MLVIEFNIDDGAACAHSKEAGVDRGKGGGLAVVYEPAVFCNSRYSCCTMPLSFSFSLFSFLPSTVPTRNAIVALLCICRSLPYRASTHFLPFRAAS